MARQHLHVETLSGLSATCWMFFQLKYEKEQEKKKKNSNNKKKSKPAQYECESCVPESQEYTDSSPFP